MSKQPAAKDAIKVLARNRKAFHEYQISERYEAGISLVGSEVKSLRDSRVTMTDGYVELRDGEAWLVGVQINEYPWANQLNHEPRRRRKLLLHKAELKKLAARTDQKGYTLVPLSFYLKNGKIKVELALAAGKRHYEKREAAKAADAQREIDQAMSKKRG